MPLTLILLNPFPSILPPRCAAQHLSSLPLLRSNNNNTGSFLYSPRKKETKRNRDLRGSRGDRKRKGEGGHVAAAATDPRRQGRSVHGAMGRAVSLRGEGELTASLSPISRAVARAAASPPWSQRRARG
ncbi:uncharacterized protein DS421_20g697590 [Arachis hypogaea]|nr:uncharacterized protein DS421_20g697590 [Arachis hypogaea]